MNLHNNEAGRRVSTILFLSPFSLSPPSQLSFFFSLSLSLSLSLCRNFLFSKLPFLFPYFQVYFYDRDKWFSSLFPFLPCVQVIRSNMELNCKCHGVSGSCTIRVCWRKMKPFRAIGDALTRKFDAATQVSYDRKDRSKRMRPTRQDAKKPGKKDLIFYDESPDFCQRNQRFDSSPFLFRSESSSLSLPFRIFLPFSSIRNLPPLTSIMSFPPSPFLVLQHRGSRNQRKAMQRNFLWLRWL